MQHRFKNHTQNNHNNNNDHKKRRNPQVNMANSNSNTNFKKNYNNKQKRPETRECHNCGRIGHLIKDCRSNKKFKKANAAKKYNDQILEDPEEDPEDKIDKRGHRKMGHNNSIIRKTNRNNFPKAKIINYAANMVIRTSKINVLFKKNLN